MKPEELFKILSALMECVAHVRYEGGEAKKWFSFQHAGDEEKPYMSSHLCLSHRLRFLYRIDLVIHRKDRVPLSIWAGKCGDGYRSCELNERHWAFVQNVATMMKMATSGGERPTPEQLAEIFSL